MVLLGAPEVGTKDKVELPIASIATKIILEPECIGKKCIMCLQLSEACPYKDLLLNPCSVLAQRGTSATVHHPCYIQKKDVG